MTTSYYLPGQYAAGPAQDGDNHEKNDVPVEDIEQPSSSPTESLAPPPKYTSECGHDVENIPASSQQAAKYASDLVRTDYYYDVQRPNPNHSEMTSLEELTTRLATPPPFPTDLPTRSDPVEDQTKLRRRQRTLIAAFTTLTFVLLAIITSLSVLLGICKQHQQNYTTHQAAPLFPLNASSLATTITLIHTQPTTLTATYFQNHTDTLTLTQTIVTSTAQSTTSTTAPQPSNPTQSETAKCEPTDPAPILTLSTQYCLLVTACNATEPTEKQECMNFCRINWADNKYTFDPVGTKICDKTSLAGGDETRARSCCGKCGCFL